jgi:hypothetical protein
MHSAWPGRGTANHTITGGWRAHRRSASGIVDRRHTEAELVAYAIDVAHEDALAGGSPALDLPEDEMRS